MKKLLFCFIYTVFHAMSKIICILFPRKNMLQIRLIDMISNPNSSNLIMLVLLFSDYKNWPILI